MSFAGHLSEADQLNLRLTEDPEDHEVPLAHTPLRLPQLRYVQNLERRDFADFNRTKIRLHKNSAFEMY